MSRIRPAWYYERQAAEATRRETFRRNNVPTPPTTIRSRGRATTLYYRSLLIRQGADPTIFRVSVFNDTLAKVTAEQAGLLATLPATSASLPLRGSGVTPSKAHWYEGASTPSRVTTRWNTSYIRYYEGGGRSHFSIPFSRGTGAFDGNDLQAAFRTVFGGANTDLLGTQNGRAYLTFERAPVAIQN